MVATVHKAVRGRTRFAVTGLSRSADLGAYIVGMLSSFAGIQKVSASPLTGNILVHCNTDNTPDSVASLIESIVRDYTNDSDGKGAVRPEGRSLSQSPPSMTQGPGRSDEPLMSRRKMRLTLARAQDQAVEDWHLIDIAGVLEKVGTTGVNGLSIDESRERLKRFGPNVLPESVPRSGLDIFLDQFKSLPVMLLGAAAGISVFTGGVADALIIAGVVVINAVIGYTTETQTEKTIHALKSLVTPSALVRREGAVQEISAAEVVRRDPRPEAWELRCSGCAAG